jgi:hypothetical protein
MSIYLQYLFDDIAEELGQGTGSNRFKAAFPRAVNRSLMELESKANTGVDFAMIESIDDTVEDLDDKYEFVLYAGVAYWLNRMGFRAGDARIASATLSDTNRLWKDAKGDYISGKMQDLMDDGEEDVVNLGYVGA